MTKRLLTFLFTISYLFLLGQSIDDPFSQRKMRKDLEIFKEIRLKANSGLYKYRTKEQIDSSYLWAENEINNASTYLDFYNIICELTDFEGSAHNDTDFSAKHEENIEKESYGYFPYPIKWIEEKWRINFEKGKIPLGSEIISINQVPIFEIIKELNKYYPTDGVNTTGKRIGIRTHFAKYYRWNYGLTKYFEVEYREPYSDQIKREKINGVSNSDYYNNFRKMFSMPLDIFYYANLKENQKYKYKQINNSTGILTIYDFGIGNETTEAHKRYCIFLDSIFSEIKTKNISNLVVDIRQNNGGDDPNDVVTYSYLTQRNFRESKEVWINFKKVPYLKYYNSSIPKFLRPFGVGKYNRRFQNRFPQYRNGKYYISDRESEMQLRKPNEKAFNGKIYLLVSPAVASAGSLFAAMVSGNRNTITVGEETLGGYYGHNGHTPMDYKLPKSKIITEFFVENIEQDVPEKSNQIYGRGIIPDMEVLQTFEDYLKNEDTQLNFVFDLIKSK